MDKKNELKTTLINFKNSYKIKEYDNILYVENIIDNDEKVIKIVGININVTKLVIPDTIENLKVKIIGKSAFKNNKNLKKVIFSNNIIKMEPYAFSNCSNLTEVELSCNLQVISKYSFSNCTSLQKLAIPFELIKIERKAFANCFALTNIFHYLKTRCGKVKVLNKKITDEHFPIKLTSIDKYAFLNCKKIRDIYLPYKIEIINKGVFKNCEKLAQISLSNNIKKIKSFAFLGCSNLKQIKLPSNLNYLGVKAFDKNIKISYYNSINSGIKKTISKYNNKIIENKALDIDSKMIPGSIKTFYNKQQLEEAIEKYELRSPFVTIIDRKKINIEFSKSKFTLKDDNYIYNNKNNKNTATIMLTGDIMCRAYQVKHALKDSNYNFDESFSDISPIIKKGDLAICNLETTTADSIPYCTEQNYIDDMIHMNAPSKFLQSIKKAGFDIVINSNNHIYDTGCLGIFETIDAMNKQQLAHTGVFAGAKDKRYINTIINGIHIGIVSYCNPNYQLNKKGNFSDLGLTTLFSDFDEKQIKKDIDSAKKAGAEFIIAYCHWGREYTDKITPNQKKFAKMVANCGADYLFGTHPHCLQHYTTIKTEDNRIVPCLYSAGNFISDMAVKLPEVRDTLIFQLKLAKNDDGKVIIASEGYYPCIIKTDENIKGGTKTYLLENLVNDIFNDKYILYNDIARIKNTIAETKRLNLLINDTIKANIPNISTQTILKERKKKKKTRFKTKVKRFIKRKIYDRKKQLTFGKICNICEIDIPKDFSKLKHKKVEHIAISTKILKPNAVLFTNMSLEKNITEEKINLINDNCLCVISSSPIKGCKCIVVDKPILKAIKLFSYIKSLRKITTITVTGSIGKTSTKEIIAKVLYEKYHKKLVASKGNSNYIPTIANNILKLNYNTKVFLQEVGMPKTKGNMKKMADMLKPDIIVYTNIKDAHIEGYGSRENIFKEKLELANRGNPNGLVFVNYDDEILKNHKFIQKTFYFSLANKSADYYATDIKTSNGSTLFTIVDNIENESLTVKINTLGDHNVMNALVAYAIGRNLKIDSKTIFKGLEKYKTTMNRQNLLEIGKYKVLADCYNSSYDSIKSILQTVDLIKNEGKKIAVIGDIFELGNHGESIHRNVGKLLAESNLDQVIFYGNLIKYSYEEYKKIKDNSLFFSSYKDTLESLTNIIKPNDLILFKASHGMHYSELIDALFGTNMGEASAIYDKRYTESQYEDFIINKYKNNITIKEYLKNDKIIKLPTEIDGLQVEKLHKNVFLNNKTITKIELPTDLVRIGNSCFENSSVENISFNKNLKRICSKAFYSCHNIKEIVLPENLLAIEEKAFAECHQLTKIHISNTVEEIADSAFLNSNNVIIVCNKNSYAEKYAQKNNIEYKITKNN